MEKIKYIILLTIIISISAFADEIPIEDYSTNASIDQQVAHLNQQMQNLIKQNLPAKIEALQQEVQKLQHELAAEKNHTITNTADSELQEYQNAFKEVRNKNYITAIAKMRDYLNNYPDGKYIVNAHYWLGEVYYLQADKSKAANEFKTVINQYPDSTKVPDAMLKLAMIYSSEGNYKASHQIFEQIKNKYPDSAAAQLMDQQQQNKVAIN